MRTIGVIAGFGIGATAKYADEVADLGDDVLGSVYKKKIASESSEYVDDVVRNTDVKQPKNTDVVEEITDNLDDVVDKVDDIVEEYNKLSVQHAVGSANQAQSVLDGIDPKYFNPDSRFGGGFYVGADSETVVLELAEHGSTAKYAIRYDINLKGQKVLDLTNSQIASEWGYIQNFSSTRVCQNIGEIARNKGYNVIKFQSYRGDGINYVIYDKFKEILSPQNVAPVC